MRPSRRPIIIASRRSLLARAQAEMVGAALQRRHPNVQLEYRWIESEGDQRGNEPLANAGGKGLFVAAIEQSLLDGRADLAVHSLKDMEQQITRGLTIAAIPPRADVRDCFITHHANVTCLTDLPRNAVVATAGPRRAAQAKHLRGDLRIELIRGNVDTRLRKVIDEKQFDATLLAMAGLIRAGLNEHAKFPIDVEQMLPAASQGALAIQCRADDHVSLLRCLPLNDPITAEAVHAERAVVAALRGNCHSPIAVLATPCTVDGRMGFDLKARVLCTDGQRCVQAQGQARSTGLKRLIRSIVTQLVDQGARELLCG